MLYTNITDTGHSTAALRPCTPAALQVVLCKVVKAEFGSMYDAGQATFAHYATAAEKPLPQDPAGFPQPGGSADVDSAEAGAGPLRVLIEQRGGEVRNFLALEELLGGCNEAGGARPRYACRSFTFAGDYRRCPTGPCFEVHMS